jgi:translation initiation factor 4E
MTSGTLDQEESDAPVLLNSKWTLWVDNPKLGDGSDDWKDTLKSLATFDSIETFWRVFNNVKPASTMGIGSNISIFRYGIEPAWEHCRNENGGKLVLTLSKKDNTAEKMDEFWLFTVLALLGETMDETGSQINGAVVSIRKGQHRIAVWTSGTDKDTCVAIGERWRKVLRLDRGALSYQTHKAAAESGRSFHNEPLFEL